MTARRWGFYHKDRIVWFGPYEYEQHASAAFQWRYGYWPDRAFKSVPYGDDES